MADIVTVVVPRTAPALYGYLRRKFADDPTVEVILDRRGGQRRQGKKGHRPERRGDERRNSSRPAAMIVRSRGRRSG
ncbi:MAG TPA: hypothetical protein VFN71_00385 [Methylomirabilota bacterium]|nr:hypothetical protein [Methylomirabilota bacterium]